jgi:hypothetical protein
MVVSSLRELIRFDYRQAAIETEERRFDYCAWSMYNDRKVGGIPGRVHVWRGTIRREDRPSRPGRCPSLWLICPFGAEEALRAGSVTRDKAPGVGPQGAISHVRGGGTHPWANPTRSMPLAPSVSPLFEIVREDPIRKRTRVAEGAAPARGARDPSAMPRTPASYR